ncbi:transcription factor bHLH19-like isoform X2 [Andrographis paniculata]|nr:transcription factor bHLH19-like isoform X2 [Andrographis paniculata]
MEDPLFIHQWPVNSIEDLNSNLHQSFSQPPMLDFKRAAESESPQAGINRPLKHHRTASWNSSKFGNMLNSPVFGNALLLDNQDVSNLEGIVKPKEEVWSSINIPSDPAVSQSCFGNQMMTCGGVAKRIATNTRLAQAQDHILAERKRREKLSQRFIALSALVPGLKKMDKASVLGDAIKYMKQLQEKVKILEKQTEKSSMESVVFVRTHRIHVNGQECSSDDLSFHRDETIVSEPLPQIEARCCNKDMLITIHCEKRKGALEKAVAQIEKLHLNVINSSVMTFGDSALNITLFVQKDTGFATGILKELVKNLRIALESA